MLTIETESEVGYILPGFPQKLFLVAIRLGRSPMGHEHSPSAGTDSQSPGMTPERSPEKTRREVLRDAAAVLWLGVAPLAETVEAGLQGRKVRGRKKWPAPTAGRRNPRFRRRKNKGNAYHTNLAPGFYLNPKSQVIHYVAADRRIVGVYRINERNLRALNPADLPNLLLGKNKPRVSLATASFAFEHAALASISVKNYALACRLLLAGIRHDQYFKQATLEEPSFRLYDMLAGVSLRFRQQKCYDEALRLARIAQQRLGQPPVRRRVRTRSSRVKLPVRKTAHPPSAHRKFKKERKLSMKAAHATRVRRSIETRLSNWMAADNSWKRLWRDVGKPLPWKMKTR